MSKILVTTRYVYFAFLAILLVVQLGLAASTVSYHYSSLQRQIAIYTVFVSVFGLLLNCVIMSVDVLRENALFSQVFIEVSWLGFLFVFQVACAAALTAVLPQLSCGDEQICDIFGAVTGIAWVTTLAVVAYLLVLLTSAILHHEAYPHVWKTGVRDFPWFMNSRPGSRLPSRPNSPDKQKEPKEPFYRKHSDLSAPNLVAPQPRYLAKPILPDDYCPNASSSTHGPIIQIAPKMHIGSSPSPPRLNTGAPLGFLASEIDHRGRPSNRDVSPKPTSRRPSRKRPPPLDLSQVSSYRN